jgi:Carboxypeptidase regulatory-like domain
LRKTIGLMAVILLLSLRGFGQATTAELSGTVQDSSGAVVPGAQVIANNIATNVAHSTVSEKNGHYVVGQLPPGDYTITVEAKGFSKLVQTGRRNRILLSRSARKMRRWRWSVRRPYWNRSLRQLAL